MKIRLLATLAVLLIASPALPAKTQNAPAQTNGKATGFKAEFFANLDDVEDKIIALAEGTPADRFAWRPASGIRSMSEVYMHIAGGNYFLATFLGTPAPKMNGDLETTVTSKAQIIAELRKSFEHHRNAASGVNDLDKPVKMFGKTSTHRGVLVAVLSHLHEHLGQSIAYARMNGVVPPWSR